VHCFTVQCPFVPDWCVPEQKFSDDASETHRSGTHRARDGQPKDFLSWKICLGTHRDWHHFLILPPSFLTALVYMYIDFNLAPVLIFTANFIQLVANWDKKASSHMRKCANTTTPFHGYDSVVCSRFLYNFHFLFISVGVCILSYLTECIRIVSSSNLCSFVWSPVFLFFLSSYVAFLTNCHFLYFSFYYPSPHRYSLVFPLCLSSCAGILEQSLGARNRVGKGLHKLAEKLKNTVSGFIGWRNRCLEIGSWAPSKCIPALSS
jgi:hypothetical protein